MQKNVLGKRILDVLVNESLALLLIPHCDLIVFKDVIGSRVGGE